MEGAPGTLRDWVRLWRAAFVPVGSAHLRCSPFLLLHLASHLALEGTGSKLFFLLGFLCPESVLLRAREKEVG